MTFVTLKIRPRSQDLNIVFALPWGLSVPSLMRVRQVSGNYLNDLPDLDNNVKVTRLELGLCVAWEPLCTKIGESSSNISSDIEQKPF